MRRQTASLLAITLVLLAGQTASAFPDIAGGKWDPYARALNCQVREAAGVAGLIKTVLALEHEELPPSIHFDTPNPAIDFASSPFYVVDKLQPWRRNDAPRRAGISSFGLTLRGTAASRRSTCTLRHRRRISIHVSDTRPGETRSWKRASSTY